MRPRAIYAFLLVALLVPLPRALSAPVQAGPSPFFDVAFPGTVAAAARHHRLVFLSGLDILAESPAPSVTLAASSVAPTPVRPATVQSEAPARARVSVRPAPSIAPATTIAHKVVAGDTLFALALQHGTTVDAIVAANRLSSADVLRLGQMLTVPTKGKATTARRATIRAGAAAARPASTTPARLADTKYEVRNGDTLSAIARRYGTSISAIVAANDLSSAHRLRIGQRLVLPSGRSTRAAAADRRAIPPAPALRTALSWPSRGVITSRYGWRWKRHHDGIDIASPRGTAIYAARAGRVRFAGWYFGYGRAVIIDHGGGLTTLYGHASTLLVGTGETVERGELIARVGCTGRCSGSHLHFEVRLNGRAVNPLGYLR